MVVTLGQLEWQNEADSPSVIGADMPQDEDEDTDMKEMVKNRATKQGARNFMVDFGMAELAKD